MDIFARLLEIGNDVASLWGGYCKKAEIDMPGEKVDFLCVERGEEFYTSLSFRELYNKYKIRL